MESERCCPSCGQPESERIDCECGFPLSLWRGLNPATRLSDTDRRPLEHSGAAGTISLANETHVVVGREANSIDGLESVLIRHREVQPRHAALLSTAGGEVYVVALSDEDNTYCDGRAVVVASLRDGSVIQCGPIAWRFDAASRVLKPLQPIGGSEIVLDAEVPGRLCPTQLTLRSGEMTALVGPSGCGKSTLLGTLRDGSGLVGEAVPAQGVFFVPQQDLVHQDLRLGDALRAIGRLYGRDVLPIDIDAALDAVGLPTSAKRKFPSELSGGQLRRFRIAGALLSGAGVMVLDEPDSGLDHETADEIISLLRSFAIRGATIVAVTHHRHVLEQFDRVIEMKVTDSGGAVASDSDPAESKPDHGKPDHKHTRRKGGAFFQSLGVLIGREWKKIASPVVMRFARLPVGLPSLAIPWLLVPLLFAIAVAISVPSDPNLSREEGLFGDMPPITRLGFLAIISVIWMSASQSHLSITRDRELYDYERSHGVSWCALLSSKSFVLIAAGLLQTTVFAALLYVLRSLWLERSFFIDERWTQLAGVWICLLMVSAASTSTGLLISCLAGRTPLVATAILPVVMMFQILFSAPFAISSPDKYEPLADYQQLTLFPSSGDEADDGFEDDFLDEFDQETPLPATTLASYGTLSRYGDRWLRSFAVSIDPVEQGRAVQIGSALTLAGISLACLIASWFVLAMQSVRSHRRPRAPVALSVLLFGLLIVPSAVADEPQANTQKTIRLPLVDGRYDENRLLEFFGGSAESAPRWRKLENPDRLGLVALEFVGKIEFELNEDSLTLRMKDAPKWELMRHLAPPRLLGEDGLADRRDVILFVHGLESNASSFDAAIKRCDALSLATLRFEYPNDGPPDEIGEHLARQLQSLLKARPKIRVQIVAHSLGGLISTWAVTQTEFSAPMFSGERIGNVFTLGTPFLGSTLAEFHNELELSDVAFRIATGRAGGWDTIHDGRGEAAEALKPGSEFLRRLHRRPRPAAIGFHLAAGSASFLTEARRTFLVQRVPAELKRLSVSESYAQRVQRLLSAEEFRDGRGDGAVTLESALGLSNPTSTKTFPLNHLTLVSDAAPLEWVFGVAGLSESAKEPAK